MFSRLFPFIGYALFRSPHSSSPAFYLFYFPLRLIAGPPFLSIFLNRCMGFQRTFIHSISTFLFQRRTALFLSRPCPTFFSFSVSLTLSALSFLYGFCYEAALRQCSKLKLRLFHSIFRDLSLPPSTVFALISLCALYSLPRPYLHRFVLFSFHPFLSVERFVV